MTATRRVDRGFALLGALTTVTLACAQGGDGPDDAVVIPDLPFTDSGTTVGFTDDFDVICPYSGSTSPDVWYELPPPTSPPIIEPDGSTLDHLPGCPYSDQPSLVSIELCNSGYDTKTYVLDEHLEVVHTYDGMAACNDDFCSSPNGSAFRSFLSCVPWRVDEWGPDTRRFVVVDGWFGDAGPYELVVGHVEGPHCDDAPGCLIDILPDATFEPDDCAIDEPRLNDQVNGGCNADPPAFMDIACDEDVCGTVWQTCTPSRRDTDWYRIDATSEASHARLRIEGVAEFQGVVGRVLVPDDCAEPATLAEWDLVSGCARFDLTTSPFPAGTQYVFVAPFSLVDCDPTHGPPAEIGEYYCLRVACLDEPCPGDLDDDGVVGFADLLLALSTWGACPGCAADLDANGLVDFADLLVVLSTWGACA